jgi:hypothetical protein
MSLKLFLIVQFKRFYHSLDFEDELQNIRGNVKGRNMLSLLDKPNKNGVLMSKWVDKRIARHSGRTHSWIVSENGLGSKNNQFFSPRP